MAFVGLNPVLLELAVGGAHNDTLVMASLAAALALAARGQARARRRPAAFGQRAPPARAPDGAGQARGRAADAGSGGLRESAVAVVAGMGVKITAGVVLPFVVLAPRRWRERGAVLVAAVLALAGLAALGLIGFGSHTLGFLDAVGEQQQLVATHSVPAETARLVGLSGTPSWWRHLYLAGFGVVLALDDVAHRPRLGLARDGGLGDARAAGVHGLAAAVVRDLAAAASGPRRGPAAVCRHAAVLRLRDPDPPAAG